ncbi:MAG: hypothetical protein IJU52_03120 [Clostridia bacterium]|nr:hypothetical protein [Clostridia bacterium]
MHSKKGTTLAEMVIVMAVVAVMSVMVVTFSILCDGWVHIGIQRYRLVQDEQTASTALHDFVNTFDDADYYFENFSGHELSVRSHSDASLAYELRFDPETDTLRYTVPGRDSAYPVEHISSLSFYIRTVGSENKQLICCTVHYILPAVNTQKQEIVGSYDVVVATRAAGK